MVVRFRKAKPGEYRHGPEDDEGVPYPVLGVTAYFPGFDRRRFLQRNRRRIFLGFVVNRGFRALTRCADPDSPAARAAYGLARAFTQPRADRKSIANSSLPALLQGEGRANGCSIAKRLNRLP